MKGLCQLSCLLTLMVTVLESEATSFDQLKFTPSEDRIIHGIRKRGDKGQENGLDVVTTVAPAEFERTEDPDYEFLGAIRKRFSRSSPPPSPESNEYFGKKDKRQGEIPTKGIPQSNLPTEDSNEWGGIKGGGRGVQGSNKVKPAKFDTPPENFEPSQGLRGARGARRDSSEEYEQHHHRGGHHGRHGGHHSSHGSRHHHEHDESSESRSRESSGSEEGSHSHERYHH